MPQFVSVHITASSQAEAEKIAEALVGERLAACVNIIPGVKSVYRWKGNTEVADEIVLVAKARAGAFGALCARVKALHSHECPCIVALPVVAGHQPYLDWMTEATVQDD